MISLRIFLISITLTMIISAAFTRYLFPQVQTKTVEVVKTTEHNNVITVVHTIKAPDGTIESTTTTTDKSIKTDNLIKDSMTAKTVDWHVHALTGFDILAKRVVYGGAIERRIIGPIDIGVFGLTNGVVGVSLGLSF